VAAATPDAVVAVVDTQMEEARRRIRPALLAADQVADSVRMLNEEFADLRVGDLLWFQQRAGAKLNTARMIIEDIQKRIGG